MPIRAVSDGSNLYTFWDYQAGAWAKDNGLRIDHLLLSPQAADCLTAAGIDKPERGWTSRRTMYRFMSTWISRVAG